jgi:phosphatidylcholine synthase
LVRNFVRCESVAGISTYKTKPAVGWAIHAFTASGAVLAFLAFLAVEGGQFRLALWWLAAALVVDGVDGPLARWAGVKERTPEIDGATLDLVVDYLTYVFVPAVLLYRAGLLPPDLALAGVTAILLSSLYTFARTDMKTADNFFRGFPAVWNVVVFYLFVFHPDPMVSAAVVVLFAVLTFAPIHFIHPVRVTSYRPWLSVLMPVWAASCLALLWPQWPAGWQTGIKAVCLLCGAALFGIGLIRTLRRA